MAVKKKKAGTQAAKKKNVKKVNKKATKKTTTKKSSSKKSAKKAVKKVNKSAAKKKATKKAAKKTAVKSKASAKTTTNKAKSAGKKANAPKMDGKKSIYEPQVVVGQKVPNFKLPATGGKDVSLDTLSGKKVVLYFYPKDATPGCTIEGHDFTRMHQEFQNLNAEVFGISRDTLKSHENFKSKQNYSIDLISDENEDLCKVFGVIKLKNMYGKQVRGIERSTFVINESGELVQEWRGVKVPGHAEEVLEFVKR